LQNPAFASPFIVLVRGLQSRFFSSAQTVVATNGVVVCWHPDEGFPYECSKAIDPQLLQELAKKVSVLIRPLIRERVSHGITLFLQDDSVLRRELLASRRRSAFGARGPSNHELSRIFYTTKHEWFSRWVAFSVAFQRHECHTRLLH
jgi:hypothetical protein